jgi:hypothetical protein
MLSLRRRDEEDFALGTGRVLVVHRVDGSRERLGIAQDVSLQRLAETAAAWGKPLAIGSVGDGNNIADS